MMMMLSETVNKRRCCINYLLLLFSALIAQISASARGANVDYNERAKQDNAKEGLLVSGGGMLGSNSEQAATARSSSTAGRRHLTAALPTTMPTMSITVKMLKDTSYVDTGESSNLVASIANVGLGPALDESMTDFTSDTLSTELDGFTCFVVPELERGSFFSSLSSADITALSSWVSGGNILIVNADYSGRAAALLNGVFGWSLSMGSTSDGNTASITSAAADTAFESGPSTLYGPNGNYALETSSIPSDGSSIYTYGSDSYVADLPYGDGLVVYLSYDWYDGAYDDWDTVLQLALSASSSISSAHTNMTTPSAQPTISSAPRATMKPSSKPTAKPLKNGETVRIAGLVASATTGLAIWVANAFM